MAPTQTTHPRVMDAKYTLTENVQNLFTLSFPVLILRTILVAKLKNITFFLGGGGGGGGRFSSEGVCLYTY